MEVAVKHNSISIHNVVHGVQGIGNVEQLKSTPSRRVSLTPWRTPCTASQQAHSLTHMPHPNTIHKLMNMKLSRQILPTNTGQQW